VERLPNRVTGSEVAMPNWGIVSMRVQIDEKREGTTGKRSLLNAVKLLTSPGPPKLQPGEATSFKTEKKRERANLNRESIPIGFMKCRQLSTQQRESIAVAERKK